MARRWMLLALLAGLVSPACDKREPHDTPGEPVVTASAGDEPLDVSCDGCTVVFLNIGMLRPDFMGIYGADPSHTPNIDRYFGHGFVFQQALAPAGATYHSATAIATSTESMFNTHSVETGMGAVRPPIPGWTVGGGRWRVLEALKAEGEHTVDRLPTIAQTLGAAGYRTAAVNDWIHTGQYVFLDRGFEENTDLSDVENRGPREPTSKVPPAEQVQLVIDGLTAESDRPAYVYFHPNTLHFPYPHPDRPDEQLNRDARDVDAFRRAYALRVAQVDEALAPLLELLYSPAWRERALVVLYSNHGMSLGDGEEAIGVGTASQDNIHAALSMRHPRVQRRVEIPQPVSLVDLGPTIYELVGVAQTPPTRAYSMTGLMSGTGAYERPHIFGRDLQEEYVREGRWKLIIAAAGDKRLLDIEADPRETVNLLQEHPDVAARLEMALETERQRQLAFANDRREALHATVEGRADR